MATKERYQNPVVGDLVNLRLFTYNSNNLTDVMSVEKIEIFLLDPSEITAENKDGRRLVETFDGTGVTVEDVGSHVLQFEARLLGELACADNADANHDGVAGPTDAAIILQTSAGLIS